MKRRLAIAVFLLFHLNVDAPVRTFGTPNKDAGQIVRECVTRLGGLEKLQNVKTLSYHSFGHTFLHAVSASDSLPGLFAYETKEVTLQPQRQLVAETSQWQWTETAAVIPSSFAIGPDGGFIESNGKRSRATADKFYEAVDTLAANPISVLLAASTASDLELLPSSGEEYRVSFRWTVYGQPIETKLAIDMHTVLPRWLEIRHSYSQDLFSSIWGRELTRRFDFSGWFLDSSGVYFPTKWKISANDLEEGQVSLVDVKINPETKAIPDIPKEFQNSFEGFLHQSAAEFAKKNLGSNDRLEIRSGIVMLPGKERAYNSLIVRQDNGLVIIEGPYSNANSEQVLAYARSAFPDAPVLSIVSTDYFWFHLLGLPAYAMEHIPIYVLDANADLVRHFLSSSSFGRVKADHMVEALVRPVANRTEIGSGKNRIVLLPFRYGAGERMMAVYLPDAKLLYCSDLFLPKPWAHQYLLEHLEEIRELIDREKLDVQSLAGVSMPPSDWKDLALSLPPRTMENGH